MLTPYSPYESVAPRFRGVMCSTVGGNVDRRGRPFDISSSGEWWSPDGRLVHRRAALEWDSFEKARLRHISGVSGLTESPRRTHQARCRLRARRS